MADNNDPTIIFYGTLWCPDCTRSKEILDEQQIAYSFVDIDVHPEGERKVLELNNENRSVPTIVFPDGTFLVEPTRLELLQKLGGL